MTTQTQNIPAALAAFMAEHSNGDGNLTFTVDDLQAYMAEHAPVDPGYCTMHRRN